MLEKSIKEIIERVRDLPPLPAAVQKLGAMTSDPRSDIRDIARVISSDVALTGRILRVANSAFYGLSRRISTISQAIMIIGFDGVKNMALGVSVFKFSSAKKAKKQATGPCCSENFWRHSLATACASQLLATLLKIRVLEETFVAGLIHDIGKIFLLEHFPEEYENAIREASEAKEPLVGLEKKIFGMNYAEIGEQICQHWNIPANLTYAVAAHSKDWAKEPSDRQNLFARVVGAADILAKISRIGFDGDPIVNANILNMQNSDAIPAEYLHQVLLRLPAEVHKSEVFFNLEPTVEQNENKEFAKNPVVCMLVQDPSEREFVALVLLSMGYHLISYAEIDDAENRPVAAIIDSTLSEQIKQDLENLSAPLINFEEWRQDFGNLFHIQLFEKWLFTKLPPLKK